MANVRITVRVMVLNAENEVLLMKRSLTDENAPGRVDFPGGGVEIGENCETAMKRELLEEAGLQVEESGLQLVYTFTRFEGDTSVIRLLYVTKVSNQQVTLSFEHESYTWQSLDEIEQAFSGISWEGPIRYIREHELIPA